VHEDGKGFNVIVTSMPVSGRLIIREPKQGEDQR